MLQSLQAEKYRELPSCSSSARSQEKGKIIIIRRFPTAGNDDPPIILPALVRKAEQGPGLYKRAQAANQ
jgi:hypothetical protein